MDDLDIIVAMQHRNRNAIHDLKGLQASIGNRAFLIEHREDPDHPSIPELRHWESKLKRIIEEMQSDT